MLFYFSTSNFQPISNLYVQTFRTISNFFKRLFILPIRGYQIFISPMMGANCRFQPSCSHYMIGAIKEWGVLRGIWMGLRRIFSCHPWNKKDPFDPVPKNPKNN